VGLSGFSNNSMATVMALVASAAEADAAGESATPLATEIISSHKRLGDPIIEAFGLHKSYKLAGGEEVPALREINLNATTEFVAIRRGEFVMIRGPSGGGKTTLLNIFGTIDTPNKGKLRLFGELLDFAKTSDSKLADLRLRKIGFVFQTFNLLATLSAYENVELPMSILGKLSAKERDARVKKLLRAVGLEDRMTHLPSELSGGEQQRVTIARALVNEPEILLLDEPTGDLDTRNTVSVMDLLLKINQTQGMTCVMVTHNPDLECYADRILYVADGHFVSQAVNTRQTRLHYDSYVKYLNVEANT
jgi:putative ABC transport system ATP-binding protein